MGGSGVLQPGGEGGWEWGEAQRLCIRLARRYARDPGEAEEISQDALLRAWRRRSTLRESERRDGWLATIVRNEAFRHRSRRRPDPAPDLDEEGHEDARVNGVVERADLHAALANLPDRDRELLVLRYGEDLTYEAIALRLGIPEGTVKVRLHRARGKLKRVYAPG